MIPFRSIVLPTDYSPACESIVPWVKEMAERFSCQISLVHAYEERLSLLEHSTVSGQDELRVFENHRLRMYASKILPAHHVDCFAAPGEPGTVIGEAIAHHGGDLVMLPTHGRGPVRRLLLGSVTAKILHDSGAAVWTAGYSAIPRHAPPYQSILCSLDDSDEAETVLLAAAAMAEHYEAGLAIIHVVGLLPAPPEADYALYEREIGAAANARIRELKSKLRVNAPHRVVGGLIAENVREEALRLNADLIVTGRGLAQSGFSRIWSSLYEIVRDAPCPVLSI